MAAAYGMPFAPAPSAQAGEEVKEVAKPSFEFPEGKAYAYLIDWSDYFAPKALYELQKAGIHAEIYVVDPNIPSSKLHHRAKHLVQPATKGVENLKKILLKL